MQNPHEFIKQNMRCQTHAEIVLDSSFLNYQYAFSRLQTCWDLTDVYQWIKGGHKDWWKPEREKRLTTKVRLSVVPYGPEDHADHGFELNWHRSSVDSRYKLVEDMKDSLHPWGIRQTVSTS